MLYFYQSYHQILSHGRFFKSTLFHDFLKRQKHRGHSAVPIFHVFNFMREKLGHYSQDLDHSASANHTVSSCVLFSVDSTSFWFSFSADILRRCEWMALETNRTRLHKFNRKTRWRNLTSLLVVPKFTLDVAPVIPSGFLRNYRSPRILSNQKPSILTDRAETKCRCQKTLLLWFCEDFAGLLRNYLHDEALVAVFSGPYMDLVDLCYWSVLVRQGLFVDTNCSQWHQFMWCQFHCEGWSPWNWRLLDAQELFQGSDNYHRCS